MYSLAFLLVDVIECFNLCFQYAQACDALVAVCFNVISICMLCRISENNKKNWVDMFRLMKFNDCLG